MRLDARRLMVAPNKHRRVPSVDQRAQRRDVLVGPRPHAVAHDNYFGQVIANYASGNAHEIGHYRLRAGEWILRRDADCRRHAAARTTGPLVHR
jgi:hypothetical protein